MNKDQFFIPDDSEHDLGLGLDTTPAPKAEAAPAPVDPPAPVAEAEATPAPAAEGAPAEPEDKAEPVKTVPYNRFQEVIAARKAAEGKAAELQAELDAVRAAAKTPAAAATPVARTPGATRKILEKTLDGEFDEGAKELEEVLDANYERAVQEAVRRIEEKQAAAAAAAERVRQAAEAKSASEAAASILQKHPELNEDAAEFDPEQRAVVGALADFYVGAKGIPLAQALVMAAEKHFGKPAPAVAPPALSVVPKVPGATPLERAKIAARIPPAIGTAGESNKGTRELDPMTCTEAEWLAAPKSERDRIMGIGR